MRTLRQFRRAPARSLPLATDGVKISGLPRAATLAGDALFEVAQGGQSFAVAAGAGDLRLYDTVSALDYGLSTTGTGLDNSAAIERALAASPRVYIPAGVYNVETQYDGTASGGGTVVRRICIRVPANRELFGTGTLQYTSPPSVAGPFRLYSILSIVGSNVRIRGLTFNDAHISVFTPPNTWSSTCRASGIVCGDGEDPSVTWPLENITIEGCTFTNNFYAVYFVTVPGSPTTISDFRIMHNRGIAHPTAGSSGGFLTFGRNPHYDPAHPPMRSGMMAFNLARNAKTAAAFEFGGQTGGTMIGNIAEDCNYAGFETEGGTEEITFVGNVALRCGNPIWTNDSRRIAIVGNIARAVRAPLSAGSTEIKNGILVARGGFDGNEAYQTTSIVVAANVLTDGRILTNAFGTGGGSFGSVTVVANDVRQADETDLPTSCISMSSGGPRIIMANSLQGGSTASILLSSSVDQPTNIIGNITRAVAAEASDGIACVDTTEQELLHGFNNYLNGIGALIGQVAGYGNRDAATVTRNLSQAGHRLNYGTGNPETVLDGTISDLYQRHTDAAGPLWVKTSGLPVPIGDPLDYGGWKPLQMLVSGDTASRPAIGAGTHVGFRYYDTTLGKPVWWNGTAWKDAAGTTA